MTEKAQIKAFNDGKLHKTNIYLLTDTTTVSRAKMESLPEYRSVVSGK